MLVHILGDSHAPIIFRAACEIKKIPMTEDITRADLVIIAQDTPTNESGHRDQGPIVQHVYETLRQTTCPVILTSQVTPGFTRQFNCERLYCQAETLRMRDPMKRALEPEQIIVGMFDSMFMVGGVVEEFYLRFLPDGPIVCCSYEEAEFSKIAINVTLAHQVTLANALSERAKQYGCDWNRIRLILGYDKRMGAYTEPGDWKKSRHLLRDYVWFHETSLEDR